MKPALSHEGDSPPATQNAPLFRGLALAIAALAVLVRAGMARATHFTGEDALITLRYAENLAQGRGFVYNPGSPVLGTTTPLYTLLLALFAWLHLDALALGKACNILAEGLTCFLLARMLARKEIGQPIAGLVAALLYAVASLPISVSISGMETGLVTCVGVGAITAYLARRAVPLYILGALLFLLRIDGLLLFALLAVALTLQTRRLPLAAPGLALLLVLPWLVFAFATFGSPVPASLLAKLTVYGHPSAVAVHLTSTANRAAFRTQFAQGWTQRIATALALVGAANVFLPGQVWKADANPSPHDKKDINRSGRASVSLMALRVPLFWLLLYYGTMFFSPVPVQTFGWYFLPPWPLFTGLVALGGACVLQGMGRSRPTTGTAWQSPLAWGTLLAVLALAGISHLPIIQRDLTRTQALYDGQRRPMGEWLGRNVQPGERILLEPIGYIGYYAHRDILDETGLVSPEVLSSYRTDAPLRDIVTRFRPEWLCLRPDEEATLRESPSLLEKDYRFVRSFAFPDAVTYVIYQRADTRPVLE